MRNDLHAIAAPLILGALVTGTTPAVAVPLSALDAPSSLRATVECNFASTSPEPVEGPGFDSRFGAAVDTPSCADQIGAPFDQRSQALTLGGLGAEDAPFVLAETELQIEGIRRSGTRTRADVALDYAFAIFPSEELGILPAGLLVPLTVTAHAQTSVTEGLANLTAAGASVRIYEEDFLPDIVALVAGYNDDDPFLGLLLFEPEVAYQVSLRAGCSTNIDIGGDGLAARCSARADPAFAIDAEALAAEFERFGLDHPNPETLFELRFSADLQHAMDVPEPGFAPLGLPAMLGFAVRFVARKRRSSRRSLEARAFAV